MMMCQFLPIHSRSLFRLLFIANGRTDQQSCRTEKNSHNQQHTRIAPLIHILALKVFKPFFALACFHAFQNFPCSSTLLCCTGIVEFYTRQQIATSAEALIAAAPINGPALCEIGEFFSAQVKFGRYTRCVLSENITFARIFEVKIHFL